MIYVQKIVLLTFVIVSFSNETLFSQFDTLALKKEISDIHTERDHVEFWDYIHHRDQDMMSRSDKELIDQEDLILVSYYLNRFGYPDHKVLGPKSTILNMVWVHTTSEEVKKLTFPILLQAYQTGVITKDYLLIGFVQGTYHRFFDDNEYLSKPLGTIFEELGFNVSATIPVQDVISNLKKFNEFLTQPKKIIGNWKMPDITDTFFLKDKPFIKTLEGVKVSIYQSEPGNIYFTYVFKINSPYDPLELVVVDQKRQIFREKNKVTNWYYQISQTGDLEYHKGDNKILFYLKSG